MRICSGLTARVVEVSPDTIRHSAEHSSVSSGCSVTTLKEIVQRVIGMVDLLEPAGGAAQQHDAWFRLQGVAQPPSRVGVDHVREEHVQVLHQQHNPFPMAVCEIQNRPQAAIGQVAVIPCAPQVIVGQAQIGALVVRSLLHQTTQALQPEFPNGGDLVILLGEHDGIEPLQRTVPAHLGRHAQQQVGFSAAPRSDHQCMGVGLAGTRAQAFQKRIELAGAHTERRYDLIVCQEARVVFLDADCHCGPPFPIYRWLIGVKY